MQAPDGLTSRPLAHADARAVFEVIAAQELEDIGSIEIEMADIVGGWRRPSFDLAASTIGVFDGNSMVGYGEVSYPDRGDAAVLPGYRGRGIGTALALWMQETARHQGATVVGMPVPEGSPGDRLLESLGYRVRWTSWVLKLPEGATIIERTLPEGYAVREADPAEYATVHDVKEDAFLEWSVRERQPYDDFHAVVIGRHGFEPWQLRVVTDPDAVVVGMASCTVAPTEGGRDPEAFIASLAVRRDHRNRGLAQALMVDAFAQARAHGAVTSALSTDSRTGALGLYEKVGMQVTSVWVNRGIEL